jgi:hypothetical protein
VDIWAWVFRTIEELREAGHDRLAEDAGDEAAGREQRELAEAVGLIPD